MDSKNRQQTAAARAISLKDGAEIMMVGRAMSRQKRPSDWTSTEEMLSTELRKVGLSPVKKQAIGRYNVDIGCFPVAIQIWNRSDKCKSSTRTDYILNKGWGLIFIRVQSKHHMLKDTELVAKYVKEFYDYIWSGKSGGQIRFINDSGDEITRIPKQ